MTSASLAVLAFAALGGAAAAAERPQSPEIIVTAPLEGSRIESLQGADVLKREDIVATLNGSLGNTLATLPGVSTTFFGAGASRPIIRGLGDDRVRVLQNGIGAIDASTASPDHAVTADGLDAERIEVLRGAAALAYGGNAVGGVVNVIDQSIPTRAIEGFGGDAFGALSSVDDGREASLKLKAGGGGLAGAVSASGRETADYETPNGKAENSRTSLRAYSAGGSLIGDRGFVGAAVKRTNADYGLVPEAPGEPGGRIEMEQTRVEVRGDAKVDWGIFDRVDFAGQTSDYTHTEFEGDGEAGTRFDSSGWEARAEAHHKIGGLDGVVGVQASDVDFAAFGEEAFISPSNTQDLGAFLVERWDTGAWGVEAGARVERRELTNTLFRDRSFTATSGSLGVFARPAQGWFVGATLARTERAPTVIELYADGPHLATANYEIGSDKLDKEIATSIEGSVRYASDRVSFELNAYRVEFQDYIALVERGDFWWLDEDTETSGFAASESDPVIPGDAKVLPVFAYVQKDATFTGGEASVSAKLFDVGAFAISGRASVDVVRAEFDAGGAPPRIPPRTARVGLSAESDRWGGTLEVVDTAKQSRVAAFETSTEGFTMLNAGLVWRPGGKAGAVSVRLDGRNLTDELGRVHASFLKDELPLPGRSVRLALTASF